MKPSEIHRIVKSLIQDLVLVTNYVKFLNSLKLKANFVQSIIGFKNGSITDYELFSKIITEWISAKGKLATVDKLCKILEKEHFQDAADKLQSKKATHTVIAPIWFGIGKSSPNFVGRADELLKIRNTFESADLLMIVTGLGGVGKSELVKKVACSLFDENQVHCIWLNGDTPDNFKTSVTNLANFPGIQVQTEAKPNEMRPMLDIFVEIVQVLRKTVSKRILVIIDNVDKKNAEVKSLLSKINPSHCFVIVTSRNIGALDFAGRELRLDVLTPEMAKLFIKNSKLDDESADDIDSLCRLIQNFPLALQQAVAVIKHRKRSGTKPYKIEDYLKDYEIQNQKPKLLDFPLNKIEHEYTGTTFVTWNVSIHQIEKSGQVGRLAIELLDYLAYFEPDDISIEFVYQIHKAISRKRSFDESSERQITQAVELIKEYSLVKFDDEMISIHRLVQEVTRVNLSSRSLEFQLLERLLSAMDNDYKDIRDSSINGVSNIINWKMNDHFVCTMRHAVQHDNLIRQYPHLPFKLLQQSHFLSEMKFVKLVERRMIEVLGENHFQTLRVGILVGGAMTVNAELGGVKKLSEVFQKAQSVCEEVSETKSVAEEILQNLGMSNIRDETEADESVALLKVLYKSSYITEDNLWLESCLRKLGGFYRRQKKQDKGIQMYQDRLSWEKTNYGEEDWRTLNKMEEMGKYIFKAGEFQKARDTFQSLLELRRKVYGETDYETFMTGRSLGVTLVRLGEKEGALHLLQEQLSLMDKIDSIDRHSDERYKTRRLIEKIENDIETGMADCDY